MIGVRFVPPEDETDREPWKRPPSRKPRYRPIEQPLPPQVRAVLAQRLFVEKTGLPSAMLNRMRRIAAFQNPEFYQKQGMRLSTALTPRVICCAEEEIEHVAMPRGCLADLRYRSIGYEVVRDEPEEAGTRPAPIADAGEPFEGDAVIEWDLEALRALEWDE